MTLRYGVVEYSPHGHKSQSVGTVNGFTVVVIHKHKNHTHSNTGIYSVEVNGQTLPQRYREINAAREAGRLAYEAGHK